MGGKPQPQDYEVVSYAGFTVKKWEMNADIQLSFSFLFTLRHPSPCDRTTHISTQLNPVHKVSHGHWWFRLIVCLFSCQYELSYAVVFTPSSKCLSLLVVLCVLSRQRTSCSLVGVDSLEQSILKDRKLVLEITGTKDRTQSRHRRRGVRLQLWQKNRG